MLLLTCDVACSLGGLVLKLTVVKYTSALNPSMLFRVNVCEGCISMYFTFTTVNLHLVEVHIKKKKNYGSKFCCKVEFSLLIIHYDTW